MLLGLSLYFEKIPSTLPQEYAVLFTASKHYEIKTGFYFRECMWEEV